MKRKILVLMAALFVFFQTIADVKLQGRPVSGRLAASVEKLKALASVPPNASTFKFSDVVNWTGQGENEAVLIVQWNCAGENYAQVWGYRWKGTAIGAEMVVAIAQADPKFYALIQSGGAYGMSIGGIGYDANGNGNFVMVKNGKEYPFKNGLIDSQTGEFDGFTSKEETDWWQGGWYGGYWSYWNSEGGDLAKLKYASTGATGRQLKNGSVDAWNFSVGMQGQPWKELAPAPVAKVESNYSDGFFFLNEGWFGHDNGSINWYDNNGKLVYNVDKKENGGAVQLGLTSCFGQIYGNELYVTSKQGNRFVSFDAVTMKVKNKLEAVGDDGRGLVNINGDKLYIGTQSGISVYNKTSNQIEKTVTGLTPNMQVGTMERVGKYVFASQENSGVQVIDIVNDAVVKTLEIPNNSGLVVSKDGNVWVVAGNKIYRINPVTLESTEHTIENTISGNWGAWKSDQICASYAEDALFYAYGGGWTQTELGKLRIKPDGSVEEDNNFKFVMPEGETQPMEFYGVLRINPHTGNLIVSTTQSGWGNNYEYNWIMEVNPATGKIEKQIQLKNDDGKNYYWFPSLPVFPDISGPEVTLEDMQFGTPAPLMFHVSDFVSDRDNLSVLAEVEALVDDPSIAKVEFDGINLTVTPLAQGETGLTVRVNSNGKLSEKSVRLSVDDLSSVDGSVAADLSVFPTLVLDYVKVNGNGICRMSVYDLLGTKMIDRIVDGGEMVDMSNLPSGNYIVKVQSGSTVVTQKIVKR